MRRIAYWASLIGACFAAGPALAQEAQPATDDAPVVRPTISGSFGDTGLMARFNSSEQYGAVQARVGLYNAHDALIVATGRSYDFDDNVTSVVTPVNAIIPLPMLSPRLFAKVGYTNILSRGGIGTPTRIDNDSQVGMAQLVWLIGDDALVGAGVIHETSDVSLRHNGGDIASQGKGVRFDMLYRFAPHWGASLRVSRLSGDADTTIPNARLGAINSRQDFRRMYSEAALVGTYRHAQAGFVPKGWVLRPSLAFVWQDSKFKATTNSLNAAIAGRSEDYQLGIATLRLEKDGFRPWKPIPYAEAGMEHEVRNTLTETEDDPTNLYLKAGGAMNMGGKGRLDLYVARRDSLKGSFQSTTVNLLLSMAF
ncbi:autotransporter domain-containing protein [Sphingobium yanoikuyae]|uniref:autotransporter domain-containing protein n=1 Tax=Sphingobium yanoikuyae TaxID=13690 RepID=UPI0026F1626B|nr:autotransporter domain-containing protein [Sphingobium yanoikuyae]